MKLRTPNESPPNGGFYYVCDDGRTIVGTGGLRRLVTQVSDYLAANGNDVPDDLAQIIEDQICMRIPSSYCWEGFGDKMARVISGSAGLVDKVFGTELKKKAARCSTCGQRRRKLNSLVN